MANKLSIKEWAELINDFYESMEIDRNTQSIEQIAETVQESPIAEEIFIDNKDAYDIAEGIHKIWNEQEEKNLDPYYWAKILGSFYEDNDIDYSTGGVKGIAEDILNSPIGEEMQITKDEADEIAHEVEGIFDNEQESFRTAFNNPSLFIKEYRGYLVGKKVMYGDDNKEIVDMDLVKDPGQIIIFLKGGSFTLDKSNFQKFIDGEEIEDISGYPLALILQEEKENNSLNHPEFKYYVINQNNKIIGGFEYKEDAINKAEERKMYGEKVEVESRKNLERFGIFEGGNNINDWLINEHDWVIIEKCVNAGSDVGEYSPKEATKYIEGFKKDGSYISVIKARLIYCLANAQQKLRGAYIVSNLESINEKCDENCRIQKELKRIIAMEK